MHVGGRRLLQHLDRGGDNRGAVGQDTLAGEEPPQHLAGKRQAARALVGGPGADDRVGDARGVVVLHVAADAARFVHDGYADLGEMRGIADTRQLPIAKPGSRSRDFFTTPGTVMLIP